MENPIEWNNKDVISWLARINCLTAGDIFEYHKITGEDLLQLSDKDLRNDLKIKRIHDRKYIMRQIEQLKHSISATVEVTYGSVSWNIRVPNILQYNFEMLRYDCARYFVLNEEAVQLCDKRRTPWPAGPIQTIFSKTLVQLEPVFLEYNTIPHILPTIHTHFEDSSSSANEEEPIVSPKVCLSVTKRLKNLQSEIDSFTVLNEQARKEVDQIDRSWSEIDHDEEDFDEEDSVLKYMNPSS